MLSGLIEKFFQDWLLRRSDGFARWLYGSECILGFFLFCFAIAGLGWLGTLFLLYSIWQLKKYFENDRKRAKRHGLDWKPSATAQLVACAHAIAMLVILLPILVWFALFLAEQTWLKLGLLAFVALAATMNVRALIQLRQGMWP